MVNNRGTYASMLFHGSSFTQYCKNRVDLRLSLLDNVRSTSSIIIIGKRIIPCSFDNRDRIDNKTGIVHALGLTRLINNASKTKREYRRSARPTTPTTDSLWMGCVENKEAERNAMDEYVAPYPTLISVF